MIKSRISYKGVSFAAELAGFVGHMPQVDEHRENLLRLQGVWDSLALLGQMSGAAADLSGTRTAFHALTGNLLDQLATRQLETARQRLRGKAQVTLDLLVRNLFERTADVGFLAADSALRAHVRLCREEGDAEASRAALEARFRAYVAKYSVYDDVVVLSPQGQVLARLDRSIAGAHCGDALIAQALRPGTPFVEHYGPTEILGGRPTGLIYATAIQTPEGAAGVLCLSFRLRDEMRAIYRQLLGAGDRTVLALRDAKGQVLLSSDRWQLPAGAVLPEPDARGRLTFFGRDYLAVSVEASAYEGYRGPGWTALAVVPAEHAFESREDEAAQAGLAAELDMGELFDEALRAIPREAARIQRELSRSLWNGKLRSRRQALGQGANPNGNDFSVTLLNEVERTGLQLRRVFEEAIGNLQNAALATVFDEVLFHARLAIDIMDRNLYERANDVRWWALDSTLQQALAAGAPREAEAVLRRINGLYTVYSLLLVFDTQGRVVAVSDPAQAQQVGRQLDQPWVAEALALRDRERYVVSPHEASGLYGRDGSQPSYVYAAALPTPGEMGAAGVVGGIAIVFDGDSQFSAMLRDAVPAGSGAEGLLLTRSGRVIASTDAVRWPVGGAGPLPASMLDLAAGESRCEELMLGEGCVHAVGLSMSGGYREYRRGAPRADEDVLAVVLQPLGPRMAAAAGEGSGFEPAAAGHGAGKRLDIAGFQVAGQAMGLAAAQVLEALARPRLTALPNAPRELVGMVSHEQRMLPVLDLGLLMGAPAEAPDAPVLVCRCPRTGQTLALRVQALGQVFSVAESQLQASPMRAGSAGPLRLVRGAGPAMLTVIEVEALCAHVNGTGVLNGTLLIEA